MTSVILHLSSGLLEIQDVNKAQLGTINEWFQKQNNDVIKIPHKFGCHYIQRTGCCGLSVKLDKGYETIPPITIGKRD